MLLWLCSCCCCLVLSLKSGRLSTSQTFSVVGGLLLVVYLGPGKFSLDEKNKDL